MRNERAVASETRFGPDLLKKGTWISMDFDVYMLKEDEKFVGAQLELSNGTIATWLSPRESGFPLTLRSRVIGMCFEHYYRDLRDKVGGININWPDIHRHYCSQFRYAILADNNDALSSIQDKIRDFNREVAEQLVGVKSVQGVRIFR